ncbi:MAG: adenylate/guanylate cyclase domain-containing protein [Candidatus Binatia bacterium]
MRCRPCGNELLPGKAFCHACGAPAPQCCARCGAEVKSGFRFCPDCGAGLAAEVPSPTVEEMPTARYTPVPEQLAQKFRAAPPLAGERKQVTVLFCDLAGSTAVASGLDPEEYRELLDQYLALALYEVHRFEGLVNQVSGDGFMALFGAPIAHEDAPQRAIWAALAIRDGLAHFNQQLQRDRGIALPARIGIHTGPVVVGPVGNDLRMDYTAIGDTTNLASRLEQLARPGTILISDVTARLAHGFVRLRGVEPLIVKGRTEPVIAYEVLDVHAEASPMAVATARGLTPLVGRDEELAQLHACYERARGHFAQVVAVIGEVGSGKSRLIHEFTQRLRTAPEPPRLLEGRCAALEQAVPFGPFIAILRQYFDLGPHDPSAAETVAARLGGAAAGTAYPLLCRALSTRASQAAQMADEALKREVFGAVADLVRAESGRGPLVVTLEDLHWIDEPSQELLQVLITGVSRAPVMILVSHRPDYRPGWRTGAAVTQLPLRPLPDDDVARIARAVARGSLPPALEARVLAKAEGSPFFAEEIMRSLAEDGYLSAGEAGVRLTRPIDEISIPGSVREVLAARLDRLGASAKRVAQIAAVLGRQFHRDHVAELLADERIDVDRELAELMRRGVVHRQSLFLSAAYRFGESLTREVAYESLLHRQRRQLHGQVAALLERGHGEPERASSALIAHHYALAHDRPRAVEALLRAAADAERLPSYHTALDLCRKAWEIGEAALREAPADERFARWVMEATRAYARLTVMYGASTDPVATRAALRGRELAERLGDADATALLSTLHGMLLATDPARFAEALAIVEAAVADARRSGDALLPLSVSRAVAALALMDGDFAGARRTIETTLAELESHGQREALSDLYLSARWLYAAALQTAGDLAAAFREATETLALAERACNRTVESGSATVLAMIHALRGNYAEMRRWAERGLATAEQIGNVAGVHRSEALLLAARVASGESGAWTAVADRLEDGIGKGGNMVMAIHSITDALIGLGELTRAERVARLALARASGRHRELLANAALGNVLARLGPGAWAEAARTLDRAAELADAIGDRAVLVDVLLARGRLELAREAADAARLAVARARAVYEGLGLRCHDRAIARLMADVEMLSA